MLALLLGFFGISGCSKEIDHYGDSRIDHEATDRAIQQLARQRPVETYFEIIPPARINPKNIEDNDPQLFTIDFQDGFLGQWVEVYHNGEPLLSERLKSNPRGYADTVSFRYAEVPVVFVLRFPLMEAEETFTIDVGQGRFLGIAMRNGGLVLTLQEGPFFYE